MSEIKTSTKMGTDFGSPNNFYGERKRVVKIIEGEWREKEKREAAVTKPLGDESPF